MPDTPQLRTLTRDDRTAFYDPGNCDAWIEVDTAATVTLPRRDADDSDDAGREAPTR